MKGKNFLGYIISICVGLMLCACGDSREFDAMGMFEADEILLSTEGSGRIMGFEVREGEAVSKGALLGTIDSSALELQREKLALDLAHALDELARTQRLFKANASTKQNVDNAAYKSQSLQKELDILDDKIARTDIIAPLDGVVLEKYAFNGELTSPSKALLRMADTRTLRLKAYLNYDDIVRIKLGDKVKVYVDSKNTESSAQMEGYKVYEGVISWISSEAEFTPKTIMTKDERQNLVYAIKIDVENDGLLKIGGYGEIKLDSMP
ncbi:HlyD family efflux transporter periplasmic adaptor subunit [Helicobacter jaachi]|uniref:HlyD family efflux transporter periplasmic adaptor subunit n=1 Tax=Helicobacter jaachi TaxID=1677920 RepID=A0A4U8TAF9_9HELI|nr:HlyD family efflux transporter periplasmic adaptor subunit [Helicobacter jaachi]TLD96805.1 HlyD family efflux transporter periplasmic adaptor subunit [Helicobacter jaachi]